MNNSNSNQNQDGNNSHPEEDDEYGELVGAEEPEEDQGNQPYNEVPESEAIIGNQPSLWAASGYPDLVPSSTNSTEDDTPEAQQGVRQHPMHPVIQSHQISSSALNAALNTHNSSTIPQPVASSSSYTSACSSAQNSGASALRSAFASSSRDTGAIPKQPSSSGSNGNRYSRDLPDISNLNLSESQAGARRNAELDLTTTSTVNVAPPSSLPSSSVGASNSSRITQLEREVLSLQTQKAVLEQQLRQRDLTLQQVRQNQASSSSSSLDVHTLNERLDRLQSSLDAVTRGFDQRLSSISAQLPALITHAVQSSIAAAGPSLINLIQNATSNDSSLGATGGDPLAAPPPSSTSSSAGQGLIRTELQRFFEEQRRILEEERRTYLLNLSEVFKQAASRREDSEGDRSSK